MFKKPEKNDVTNILKIFMALFIPVVIVVFLLVDYISGVEIETAKTLIVSEQKQKIDTVEFIIESKIESNINDLMVIKDSQEMGNYKNIKSDANEEELAELFIRIAKNKKEFDQIRFIDNEGNEKIRINNRILGEPYIVEEEDLQEKRGRYYFKYADDLVGGEVYISPLDLTQENGKIQKPYKPSMRFATPIINKDGDREGILVINYLAQHALDVFEEYIGDREFVETNVFNNEGYYISGDKSKIFGFVLPQNENETLKNNKPKLWNKIENENISDDYFNIDNINYYVSKFSFKSIDKVKSPGNNYYVIFSFKDEHIPMIRTTSMINLDNMFFYVTGIMFLGLMLISILFYYFSKSRENLNTVQLVADNSNDAVFIADSRYRMTFVNKSLEDMTGYKEKELIGKTTDIFKTKRHDKNFYRRMHKAVGENGSWKGKIWNKRKDGMIFVSKLTLIGEKEGKDKKIKSYIGILNDLGDKEIQNKEKNSLLDFDKEIYTEREYYLEELIQWTMNRTDKFSLVYLYVRNNNILEITYNKGEYNEIMTKLNENINKIIGSQNLFSKLSRSEYVFELKNTYEIKDIEIFMKDFIDKVSKPVVYKNKEIFFDIKCGISRYPEDGKKGMDLITNSKIAYYVLEDESLDYQIYQSASREKLIYDGKIDEKIKEAVKNKELYVWYQPQVDSATEKVVGVEALLRWKNKDLGLVPPDIFIPAAEKNGSIIEIGNFVIEEVFKSLKIMEKSFGKDIPISINMSPEQLKYRGIIEIFKFYNKKYKVKFKNIKIEITEGMLIDSMDMINKKLKEFKDLGMDVSIDDFGTGFSSLSYLKSLRVDELKIDREFIKNIPLKDDGSIAKAVTNLGKNLNKNVIAEGVETKEQIDFLKGIGCYIIQGYYYSRPVDREEFMKFACEKNN